MKERQEKIFKKIQKRIMSVVFAVGIAFSGISLSACDLPDFYEANTDSTQSGSKTPPKTPDYSNYSQILQKVLTDDYYRALESEEESTPDTDMGSNRWSYNNPRFMAIPFGFLESQGFDIDDVKNRSLYSKSDVYTIDNDLFIELRIEIDAGYEFLDGISSYLANYIIKYKLTDGELKEVHALHKNLNSGWGRKTYLQAPLFIQELSYQKTPEIISKTYITYEAIDSIEKSFDDREYIIPYHRITYLGTEVKSTYDCIQTYQTHERVDSYNLSPKRNAYLYTLKFNVAGSGLVMINNITVQRNTKGTALNTTAEYKEEALESKTPITLLNSYYCYFENIKDDDIDEILS